MRVVDGAVEHFFGHAWRHRRDAHTACEYNFLTLFGAQCFCIYSNHCKQRYYGPDGSSKFAAARAARTRAAAALVVAVAPPSPAHTPFCVHLDRRLGADLVQLGSRSFPVFLRIDPGRGASARKESARPEGQALIETVPHAPALP
jgi:hypothetical protein